MKCTSVHKFGRFSYPIMYIGERKQEISMLFSYENVFDIGI